MPLVSICLPTLNARKFLEPRMQTILAQTLTDWELIVCDSYSDDGTWEYFQQFKNDPRIRRHQVPKAGLYAGWNECLRRATGEYIYIATADDTCTPELLEKMVGGLTRTSNGGPQEEGGRMAVGRGQGLLSREHATNDRGQLVADSRPIDIAVCDFETIDEGDRPIDHSDARGPRKFYGEWMAQSHIRDGRTEFLLHTCLGNIWWTMTAVVFRRSLLKKIGLFRTDRGSRADEEWDMRAELASDIVYVPEKLSTWRVHAAQATARPFLNPRTILDSLEAVLDDETSGVPAEWMRVLEWRDEIIRVCRADYINHFALYGHIAKESPARFVRGVFHALTKEPGFLLRQTMRGFKWDPALSPDPVAVANRLIRLFNCRWPPSESVH